MKIRKIHLFLGLILLLGLCLRLPLLANEQYVTTDAVSYLRLAKNFGEQGKYSFGENYNLGIIFPPGYPLVISSLNHFLGNIFLSAKIISLVAALLTVIVFFLIGRHLHSAQAGLFAAFCYAVYPFTLRISVEAMTESLFFLFIFLALFSFLKAQGRPRRLIIFALLVPLTYMIRPEGILLLAVPLLFLGDLRRPQVLLKLGMIVVIFFLIASPYLIFLHNSTGKFVLSGKSGFNILVGGIATGGDYNKITYGLNRDKTQIETFSQNTQVSLTGFIREHPQNFARRFFLNVLNEVKWLIILGIPIFFPLLFSLMNPFFFRKSNLMFVSLGLIFCLVYAMYFMNFGRFMFTVILLLVPVISVGFVEAPRMVTKISSHYGWEGRAASSLSRHIKPIILLLLMLSSLLAVVYFSDLNYGHPDHLRAGLFLKEVGPYESINVMSRKPWISFYSGSRHTTLPYAPAEDVISFAKLHKVDFIVVDQGNLQKWDYYDSLLKLDALSEEVNLVYEDNSSRLLKIFQMRNSSVALAGPSR